MLVLLAIVAISASAQTTVNDVKSSFDGIISFEGVSLTDANTIPEIKRLAEEQADESMDLSKATVEAALEKAKAYHFIVITVKTYTVARITDLENCIQSGSWGQCMPMGEGFVRKGGFNLKNDYINNIIGTPGNDKHRIYYFKKK